VEEKVERLTTDMRREQAAIKDQLSLLLRHFEIKNTGGGESHQNS
jgi:hypothetical protein